MRIPRGLIAGGVIVGAAFLICGTARTPETHESAGAPQESERAVQLQRIAFDDLDLSRLIGINELPADVAERLPASIRELEGREIVLRGFMKPPPQMDGIPEFVFVRDLGMCCTGPIAKLYHAVIVRLKPGETTSYIQFRPFDVTGKFRVDVLQLDDGMFMQLYCLDDAEIVTR